MEYRSSERTVKSDSGKGNRDHILYLLETINMENEIKKKHLLRHDKVLEGSFSFFAFRISKLKMYFVIFHPFISSFI